MNNTSNPNHNFNTRDIYTQLLAHYGPQGWWPLLQRSGRPGYSAEGYHPGIYTLDLEPAERFEIVTGAILTQNTSWVNVRSSLAKLLEAAGRRTTGFGPEFILELPPEELAALIRSSGYFNQKTKKLRYAAEFMLSGGAAAAGRSGDADGIGAAGGSGDAGGAGSAGGTGVIGSVAPGRAPARSELLSIWGIGPETADSILLYAYEHPVCVVDAYSMRIFKRLSGEGREAKWSYDQVQNRFHRELPASPTVYNEFHGLVVEHAKQHCTSKNPKCYKCPLKTVCKFLAQNR